MAQINPYLTFNGTCESAFIFYKSVFGGEFPYIGKFKDMPPSEGQKMSDADGEKIMHVSLPIGGGTILMGSDTGGEWSSNFREGNNFSISINADSAEEANKIFNGLSAGGTVTMPLARTFWSELFGMFTDKFGINWMMSYEGDMRQQ